MAREKKPVHRVQMTEGKRNIIHQILEEYDIQTAEDIQDALKDLLGGTIKEMMEAEMDNHLRYEKSQRSDSDDYRNGYKEKQVNSSYGSMKIEVPQDRKSTFEPQIVKKRQKDISDIDKKIISMYAKGMTTRQISDTIEDLVSGSDVVVSCITDADGILVEDMSLFKPGVLVVPVHTRGFQNCDTIFDKVFADDEGHVKGFKYFNEFRQFGELSDVLSGKIPGRSSDEERILSYNIGLGLHDVLFAHKIIIGR